MNKRDTIKQKINSLTSELKKLEEQEKQKVGEFMLDLYQKNDFDSGIIKNGIARILGDEVTDNLNSNNRIKDE